jgi:murein DD-endopeptidase MepM/ murein hydrolase activator NlpD
VTFGFTPLISDSPAGRENATQPAQTAASEEVKLVAVPLAVMSLGLLIFPAVFANGDASPVGCTGIAQLDNTLATIRTIESGDDYAVQNSGSTASGAYQFLDTTWAGYGGYTSAWQAPPAVQDAKAIEQVQGILDAHAGDVSAVPVVWYIGYVPADGSTLWDTIPYPSAGNVLTPREYLTHWLAEYAKLVANPAAAVAGCGPGGSIAPLADGYAYPGPWELFSVADVNAPHAEYPAWDWLIPVGTPIYAVRGGLVTTVQYWAHNWWDQGCGTNPTGCHTCGIGITIQDLDGTHWAYCHGSAAQVQEGQTITAGTQILTSGNTGRSGAPHVHIEITTTDGTRHCPQPLMSLLRSSSVGLGTQWLPSVGCVWQSQHSVRQRVSAP